MNFKISPEHQPLFNHGWGNPYLEKSYYSKLLNKFKNAIQNAVPPGAGCHSWIMSAANYGAMAGLSGDAIFNAIRAAIPPGRRHVPDSEIAKSIQRALHDHTGNTFTPRPRPKPVVRDGKKALQRIIDQGDPSEAALIESSPVPLHDDHLGDSVQFLEFMFEQIDRIFIGEHFGKRECIRSRDQWIELFRAGRRTHPHIIVNPLSGHPAPKRDGSGFTYRGDGNVTKFRNCLVEFDDLTHEQQIRFWSAAKLPIRALIDSGGKSIHAWLDVSKLASVHNLDQWDAAIKQRLYERVLIPLGVDRTGSNAARLSRLPGHFRSEKERFQRLLWLSPEGRAVHNV